MSDRGHFVFVSTRYCVCNAEHAPSRDQSRRSIDTIGLESGSPLSIHPTLKTRPRDSKDRVVILDHLLYGTVRRYYPLYGDISSRDKAKKMRRGTDRRSVLSRALSSPPTDLLRTECMWFASPRVRVACMGKGAYGERDATGERRLERWDSLAEGGRGRGT